MINWAETKVDFIEPNILNEQIFDYQIKSTLGITELYWFSVLSDFDDCDLDVDFIITLWCRNYKRLDCSSIKMIHELGLKRRKPVWFLSKFNIKLSKF